MVGGHGQRQRAHGTLAGRVQGAVGVARDCHDRAGVDDRCVRRRDEVGQRGAGHPGGADDVDVEHPGPLVVVVRGDVPDGADAGVVDQDVDAAERRHHRRDRAVDRRTIGDVALHREVAQRAVLRRSVEAGDARAARPQQLDGGRTDAAGPPGDDRGESVELAHEPSLPFGYTRTLLAVSSRRASARNVAGASSSPTRASISGTRSSAFAAAQAAVVRNPATS